MNRSSWAIWSLWVKRKEMCSAPAAMKALIDRGLTGDFRAPDIMRFGITPLYIDTADVQKAASIIEDVMRNRLWDNAGYRLQSPVT